MFDALATRSHRSREQAFAGLDLKYGRLDKRAKILMERFTANPTASIPRACQNWGETCAAYASSATLTSTGGTSWRRTGSRCCRRPQIDPWRRNPLTQPGTCKPAGSAASNDLAWVKQNRTLGTIFLRRQHSCTHLLSYLLATRRKILLGAFSAPTLALFSILAQMERHPMQALT